jgi:hypothetical protein
MVFTEPSPFLYTVIGSLVGRTTKLLGRTATIKEAVLDILSAAEGLPIRQQN